MSDERRWLLQTLQPTEIRKRLARCAKNYLFWSGLLSFVEETLRGTESAKPSRSVDREVDRD